MTEQLIGCAMILSGQGFRVMCMRELQKVGIKTWMQLAVAATPTRWTTAGPYRYLRHPAYWGSLWMFAGAGMAAFGDVAGLVLFVPALPHYNRRIVLEEVMRAQVPKP